MAEQSPRNDQKSPSGLKSNKSMLSGYNSMLSGGPGNISLKKVIKLLEQVIYTSKQKEGFDIVLNMLTALKPILGVHKLCLYPLDYEILNLTTGSISKEERKKHLSNIESVDPVTNETKLIATLHKDPQDVIKHLLFNQFTIPNSNDRIVLKEGGRLFALMVNTGKARVGPSFILQGEFLLDESKSPTKKESKQYLTQCEA